jgi:integrase
MPVGRKKSVYHPTTMKSDPIVGLMRLQDGRWRASGPEKYTFTQPDEAQAIAHFRHWEAKKNGQNVVLFEVPRPSAGDDDAYLLRPVRCDSPTGTLKVALHENEYWAKVRRDILMRPKYAAERTGIAKLAHLEAVEEPPPVPSFQEMKDVWKKHCRASKEQRRKVIHDFEDFEETTGVKTLKEITPDIVIRYRDHVYARNISGKSQQNLFTRIRRLVTHTRSRAMAVEECSRVIQCFSLLTPSESTVSLDPKPVSVGEWHKLLSAATDHEDRAMLLLMLNCGMYLAEVIALRWRDFKGGFLITHRKKTDRVVRIAGLWPQTLKAMKPLPNSGEYLFIANHGDRLGIKGAELRWRTLRANANVHTTSSQIRDGAATAAADVGVDEKIVNLLLGHRTGINDHYAKRAPGQVKPACDAIYARYMTGK